MSTAADRRVACHPRTEVAAGDATSAPKRRSPSDPGHALITQSGALLPAIQTHTQGEIAVAQFQYSLTFEVIRAALHRHIPARPINKAVECDTRPTAATLHHSSTASSIRFSSARTGPEVAPFRVSASLQAHGAPCTARPSKIAVSAVAIAAHRECLRSRLTTIPTAPAQKDRPIPHRCGTGVFATLRQSSAYR